VIYLLLSRSKPRVKANSKPAIAHEPKTQRWVSFFIRRPYIALVIIVGLVAAVVYILPRLETGFLPEMDEGSIVLDYASPPGTSLDETDRMLHEVEKIVTKVPEVEAYSRRTGTQMGFFITEPNTGDYLIQLKKDRDRSTEEVIEDIRKQVESTQPALRIDFGQVIGDMLGDLMTSVQPIEVKVYGDNQQKLRELSANIAEAVKAVDGTADVFDGVVIAGPSVSVQPDFTKLAQYGVTPANLQYQLQSSLQGNVVGTLLEKEQLSNIRMLYPGSRSLTVTDINRMQVFLPNGKLKPITELATVELHPGDAEVQRENLQSMGVITARLEGRDLGSVIAEIQRNIASSVTLPQGYHVEYGGAFEEQQQSFRELLMILISSSLLVFGVILFLFRSFRVALVILLVSVLGISGSYLGLYLTGTPLNVGSYTGLIMIVGIIGENAIFTYLQFRDSLQTMDADGSVIYAISTRLRPKLMTALGAIIALMPLAMGWGTGSELHQPLAIAVIGGFIIALPLLLVVLPSLLRLMFRNHRPMTIEADNA
jgi:Cu/Ag efflux pump CusA